MDRHYKVIFEALLSVLIIIQLLSLSIAFIGFIVGMKLDTFYNLGKYDLIVSVLILLDFILFKVITRIKEKNWDLILENWAYIIASIPLLIISLSIFNLYDFKLVIGLFGIIKIFALVKVLQITSKEVRKYPQKTKLDYATFILLLIVIFGSLLFFIVEKGVNPEVPNYDSAVWFSIVSMTTTGYGDIVPVTSIGQIISVIIIFSGMGYVSLATATLAFSFIDIFRKESRKASSSIRETAEGLKDSSVKQEEKIDEILKRMNEMEKKLEKMERSNRK